MRNQILLQVKILRLKASLLHIKAEKAGTLNREILLAQSNQMSLRRKEILSRYRSTDPSSESTGHLEPALRQVSVETKLFKRLIFSIAALRMMIEMAPVNNPLLWAPDKKTPVTQMRDFEISGEALTEARALLLKVKTVD